MSVCCSAPPASRWRSKTSDTTLILAHQLIAARLNEAAGAETTYVTPIISEANAWLGDYPLRTPVSGDVRTQGVELGFWLDHFNNGLMGPPHCE